MLRSMAFMPCPLPFDVYPLDVLFSSVLFTVCVDNALLLDTAFAFIGGEQWPEFTVLLEQFLFVHLFAEWYGLTVLLLVVVAWAADWCCSLLAARRQRRLELLGLWRSTVVTV